jgi:hypothetical protein
LLLFSQALAVLTMMENQPMNISLFNCISLGKIAAFFVISQMFSWFFTLMQFELELSASELSETYNLLTGHSQDF